MTRPDYDLADVLVLDRPEQVHAMTQPARHQILGLLIDRAMTAGQLAAGLGILKGSSSHHLAVLERAGLVSVVRTARVRGGTERYWGRTAVSFEVRLAGSDPAGRADLLRTVASELAAAPTDGQSLTVKRVRLRPEDQQRAQALSEALVRDLEAMADPDGDLVTLAVVRYSPEHGRRDR